MFPFWISREISLSLELFLFTNAIDVTELIVGNPLIVPVSHLPSWQKQGKTQCYSISTLTVGRSDFGIPPYEISNSFRILRMPIYQHYMYSTVLHSTVQCSIGTVLYFLTRIDQTFHSTAPYKHSMQLYGSELDEEKQCENSFFSTSQWSVPAHERVVNAWKLSSSHQKS